MASMAANILLVAVVIVLLAAITQSLLPEKIDTVQVTCSKKCPRQNETKNDEDILCDNQCITNQCFKGCSLWNKALKRNCISVCTDFDERYNFTYGQHYCTAGCNDAISLYFQRIQNEVGILPPPTLVPNSLMDTSLKLQWKGVKRNDFLYKIQWKLEYNSSFWQYCQKQDWINNFIVKLEDLLPFTNYRFRVVLLLEWSGTLQLIVSDPSVVISTRPSKVPPSSAPKIVRITPTDSSISITWAAIPFPLAPILSYHLTIQEFSKGYYAFKEILTEKENKIENVYMFRNLEPHKNYSITVAATNEFGDGSITAAIVTTLPSTKLKYTPEPINLILISDYSIYCSGKELYDIPRQLYHHNKKINSVAIDIRNDITYISDSSSSLLSLSNNKTQTILILPAKEILLDISFDWLNNEIYLLISTLTANNIEIYNIKKFDIKQKKCISIISGLEKRPNQMKIDPCNGYLFWTTSNGLYQLDLSKKLTKLDLPHILILPHNDLGPFIIDYLNFCLMILFKKENTIMSVSLDGQEVLDIRKNTARSVFEGAITLVYANSSFYWSNGSDLMGEYLMSQQYYHHIYPNMNIIYHLILSNFSDQQPIPLPINPPQSLQVIATSNKLKAFWQAPHLLAGQGINSWQDWLYRLTINFQNGTNWKTIDVKYTEIIIDNLIPGTNYLIKVAAFSSVGQGPWSSEFVIKTLNHNVSVLWGNADRILISDIMGNYIKTILLNEGEKTKKYSLLNDVAWYDDQIYYVLNSSKINWFNLTSHQQGTVEGIDSVQSIAIDWLGCKIYWSDPTKKSILRENLFGGQRELLISSSTAKELKVESVGGYLYWSTEYSIQSSKLNGKELYNYYTVNYITGEITSLAVDSVGHWVYWILREKDKSKLFRAPTFEKLIDSIFSPVQEFENLNSQGPLFYVDHHLLWLQNGNDLVISDSDGQYPAIIKALNFNGIQTFTVLDPYTRPKPNGSNTTVIPEEVNINMIKVYPKINDTTFEIVWNPVTNVNHGLILYNVIVLEKEDNTNSCISNFNTPNTHVLIHSVPLKISIEATTVWGSSKTVTVFSPIPPEPTNIRIFTKINFSDQNRDIVLQHSRLDNISHYEVHCQYNNDYIWRNCLNKTIISSSIQTTWKNLSLNIDYEFKIKACSTASCGKWSKVIVLNKVFSVTSLNTAMVFDSEILIFHANKLHNQTLIKTDSLVKFVAFDSLEDIVYWSDGINIFNSSINISDQTKVYTKTDNRVKIENLSFDWVSRTLLWCETSINQSTIISWDLISGSRNIIITSLHSTIHFLVVPSERMLIWIEKSNFYGTKKIMKLSMDTHSIHQFYNSISDNEKNNCNCSNMNPINDVITLYISNNGKNKLLWIDSDKQNIIISDIYGCECWTVKFMFPIHGITSMAVDRNNLFWTTNKKSLYFLSIEEENNLPIIKNYNTTNYLDNINAVFTIDRMPETFKRPNPPGLPKVNCLLSGCTVHWDKSESAVEVIYHLDRRFVIDDRNKRSLRNIEHDWMPVYKGPNNYWFIPDVKPNLSFMFRVRARNTFGWSDYIASDEPFKAQYQVETLRDENIPKIVLIACFIFMCLILAMITNYYWGPCKTKGPMRPDVELGRLREMPQRSTFFHAINVGYQGAVLFKKKEKSELPIIKREQISLNKQLGAGAFGEVFEGKIKNLINCETETRVAIKVLKEGATQSEMAAFMKEAKLMNNFKHKHILQLIGVCIDNDPNFIIMELMEGGDLLSYLRKNRPTSVTKSCLTLIDLIRMCIDVAEGCSYLEQMHFVHRDLACRNCLITSSDPRNLVVKIGDFGLARNIYTHDYYRRAGESLLPVKWMSPESVVDCVFTCQSDVWAFGVLLWEIMSMGQHPYPGYSNFKVICYVQQGGRLEKPINCPRTLYNLMQRCWSDDPIKRPKFEYCLKILKSFMAMPLDYVNISYDSQLQNLSTSESYTVDITYSGSYDKQITHPITNEGYEVPDKIINNEYLNLGGIEYLDLSKTSLKPPIANNARNTEPELIMTEDTLLYCNMSTEQS